MNTKALNSLAALICRAQEQDRTPMGIAFAVDAAGRHMSPETAAEIEQLRNDITGACLARWEEEQDNARLRLALASARRGRRELRELLNAPPSADELQARAEAFEERERLRARVAELEAERHSTNEALDDAVQALRAREKDAAVVAGFVAARAEYITSIRNCHPDDGPDYDRWQGHAAARRQLAQELGLPVAWPPEDSAAVAKSADKLTALMAPTQALREDEPAETGGAPR